MVFAAIAMYHFEFYKINFNLSFLDNLNSIKFHFDKAGAINVSSVLGETRVFGEHSISGETPGNFIPIHTILGETISVGSSNGAIEKFDDIYIKKYFSDDLPFMRGDLKNTDPLFMEKETPKATVNIPTNEILLSNRMYNPVPNGIAM